MPKPTQLKSDIENYIKNINKILLLKKEEDNFVDNLEEKITNLEEKTKSTEKIIMEKIAAMSQKKPPEPLPSNITQKLLMNFFEIQIKNIDETSHNKTKNEKLTAFKNIMSPAFLDRLILGKGQKEYKKDSNTLATAGKEFIENFMLSGPPTKDKKNTDNKSIFETVKGNSGVVRGEIYRYFENKTELDEKEKKHLSNIHGTAQNALKKQWEEFCRQHKDLTINFLRDSSYNKVFSSIGFLLQAKSLPEYIIKEDLLTFATADPDRFINILDLNKNNSLLRQLGDLNIFKETLKTERNSIEKEIIEIKKEIKENNPLISDKIDKANSKKRDLTLIVAKEGIEDIEAKKAIEAIEKEIIKLEEEIIRIEKTKNPLIKDKIDRANNKKDNLAKLDRLIATKEEEMALENRRNSLSQTSDPLKSQPTPVLDQELTLAKKIAFQLKKDLNNASKPVKDAMLAAAKELLEMPPEGPETPAEYYNAIFGKLESIKVAVPGTSTEKYRKMVYAQANAEQAVENILNSIDKKIKSNPDLVTNQETRANEILSYLEALKIKWTIEEKTFKFKKEEKSDHDFRIKNLNECIDKIKQSKNSFEELFQRMDMNTALNQFHKALDTLPENFRDTKETKENLSWLRTEYVVPKKEKNEPELKAAEKILPKSTGAKFSFFRPRALPKEAVKEPANDSLYSVKTPGKK